MKKTFRLKGLDCAQCAAKIEEQVKNLDGVSGASVDFASLKMTLEFAAGADPAKIASEAASVAAGIEPGVRMIVSEGFPVPGGGKNAGDEDGDRRKEILKLSAGGAVFTAGVLFAFPGPLEPAVFLIAWAILGGGVVLRALRSIARGSVFTEHFLMSIATVGAFFIGEYAEGAAVMLFYLVGELLQGIAVGNSRRSISALTDIRPDFANVKTGDLLRRVSPAEVRTGDVIVVKPGEKIPLDGRVILGTSAADTSALTGESLPRELAPGVDVLSGFINLSGVLTIEVTKEYGDSAVSKILELVGNAAAGKAPTERFITKFARYYTPAVVFGALAVAVLPPLFVAGESFTDWVYRALVFLVVSCPCALVISIPLGFFGGIGGASKRGILIKGADYLEALTKTEIVVFDKTGTLTEGVFTVTGIRSENGFTDEELLKCAAYAESRSNHPIALSVLKAYGGVPDRVGTESLVEMPGYGVRAKAGGREILAGNEKLMSDNNVAYTRAETAGSAVYVAVNGIYAGHIVISDEVKEDSAEAVRALKALGIKKTVMLTGDLESEAVRVGKQLGIGEVYSGLLPAGKVEIVERLEAEKSRYGKLVFVGDGINDAPVLARADIGIAMGGLGSDAAVEAADIVIMDDRPSKIAAAVGIAKKTRAVVFQNIVFALGVKAVFLILGAFGAASMWEAVFGDMGVALITILNSMRAMHTKNISAK